MKGLTLALATSVTIMTLTSCGSSHAGAEARSSQTSSKSTSFFAEESTAGGVALVESNTTNAKSRVIDSKFYNSTSIFNVGPTIFANVPGGAGCPGSSVIIPSEAPFTSMQNSHFEVGVVGVSGQQVLAEGIACPVASPLHPSFQYLLFSKDGKLLSSLGTWDLSVVSFGGVDHNIFLAWKSSGANNTLVEGTVNQRTLKVINTISPSKGCVFRSAPSFSNNSNNAVIIATCSSNPRKIVLESIEPSSPVAKATSNAIDVPKICPVSVSWYKVSNGGTRGVLISTSSNFGNFPSPSGCVELLAPSGSVKLLSAKMFNAVWRS